MTKIQLCYVPVLVFVMRCVEDISRAVLSL